MLRRSYLTIGREAMMLLIIACFALSTVVSMRVQASSSHRAEADGSILCLHGEAGSTGLTGDPAAPADEDGHCHTDCALCGGGSPALPAVAVETMPAPMLATRPLAALQPVASPPPAGLSVRLPPKQGPPARA